MYIYLIACWRLQTTRAPASTHNSKVQLLEVWQQFGLYKQVHKVVGAGNPAVHTCDLKALSGFGGVFTAGGATWLISGAGELDGWPVKEAGTAGLVPA